VTSIAAHEGPSETWLIFCSSSCSPASDCGPIVRAADFLPQVRRGQALELGGCPGRGAALPSGSGEKSWPSAIAWPCSSIRCFRTRAATAAYTTWGAILAMPCSSTATSRVLDMAIGAAHLLGYKLAATSHAVPVGELAEFWRRWHMSLSRLDPRLCLHPAGGSRGGRWQTCRNLLITMTLCGLWHGAAGITSLLGALTACSSDLSPLAGGTPRSAVAGMLARASHRPGMSCAWPRPF